MRAIVLVMAVFVLPMAVQAATIAPDQAGVGVHGYDFLIGTWTCTNAQGAAIGGPGTQTITFRTVNGGIAVRVTGSDFERSGYIAYDAAAKKWWKPFAYPNGNHYVEATTDTGRKTVWAGPYTDVASGKTFLVRDTYTVVSPTEYRDVGEYEAGTTWKTGYNGVCKKTS